METNYRVIQEQKTEEFLSQLELEIAGFRRRGCSMVRRHGIFEDRYQQIHGDLYAFEGRFKMEDKEK